MNEERRNWSRHDIDDCLVHVKLTPPAPGREAPSRMDCPVEDLSEGGVGIHSERFIPVGQRLRLVFEGIKNSEIPFPATVRWVRHEPRTDRYAVGCGFRSRDAQRLDEVRLLVRAHGKTRPPQIGLSPV